MDTIWNCHLRELELRDSASLGLSLQCLTCCLHTGPSRRLCSLPCSWGQAPGAVVSRVPQARKTFPSILSKAPQVSKSLV